MNHCEAIPTITAGNHVVPKNPGDWPVLDDHNSLLKAVQVASDLVEVMTD